MAVDAPKGVAVVVGRWLGEATVYLVEHQFGCGHLQWEGADPSDRVRIVGEDSGRHFVPLIPPLFGSGCLAVCLLLVLHLERGKHVICC